MRTAPKRIQDIYTINGNIGVKTNKQVKKYVDSFDLYVNNINGIYKNVKKNSKSMFQDIDNLSNNVIKVAD